jgi:hypothetical protein
MRCMLVMIPNVDQPDAPPGERAEAGDAPPAEAVARTMTVNDELVHVGARIALDGLHPRARGARVACVGGTPTVTDGPFTEATDVIGGDWMIQANSKKAVAEWAKQCPASDSDVIAVREGFERSDAPPEVQKAADHPRCARRSHRVKAREAVSQEDMMRYICLGYADEKMWEAMSERERHVLIDACFAYDGMLRQDGHFVGGEALQRARNATTLRWKHGQVLITDGP